ncbi:hypothetical protein HF324_09900 [Chitinophaga oryzae]|uniref:DUF4138 domain-containing protein n=1 Tax=Chitinophaga oryzae TaxID=2725414 RepID=A0AAE6ZEU5_9BACT|nr:hypothetical protein [Chitinophaga oryzae]QJB31670.1 hypothetical protein HF329_10235 [Chitinophaga oryzae]QJB38154.1 hypothetical protein HF324_09900 [Chitinophaga oryzae]
MKKLLMFAAICMMALHVRASFFIQVFSIPANQNKNLVVDPSKATAFKATYNLSYVSDNMFNTIVVDVVYISSTETLVVGPAKTYTATSSAGIADYIDATLPANKMTGRISLRIRSYSPQAITNYSLNSYGVENAIVSPEEIFRRKMHGYRLSILPGGNMEFIDPPAAFANTSLAPVYITITEDGKLYDLYVDPTRAPGQPLNDKQVTTGYYGLRKEFYVFTQQQAGTVPVYRYVKKANRTAVLFSMYPQDETTWEKTGTAFYAYSKRVRDTPTPPAGVRAASHVFYADPNIDRTFFAMYFPDENNKNWLLPYIIDPQGHKVYQSVFFADFQAFPAYKINP